MGAATGPSGPDLAQGVRIADLAEGATIPGRVGDQPVLLSRLDGAYHAVGGACTHYGAALGEGLVDRGKVRCPLHHACFSLRTGAALRAPAFDALDLWQVEIEDGLVFVRRRLTGATSVERAATADAEVGRIVILGGGAAGFACADALRRLGYGGRLTMVSADPDPPVDRPNLSKDYLAGTAPEDWMPLRPDGWYRERAIDLRLGTEIVRIDAAARTLHTEAGEDFPFDRLLIATGSEPIRLDALGFDRDNVHTLRSFADARGLADRAAAGSRAVVIGSSFIGLEAAAALRTRGVEVDVVSLEQVPFAHIFGEEIGRFFHALHSAHGVRFHLGAAAASFDGGIVRLADGTAIAADLVLLGIGVRPRIGLAAAAGLAVDRGIRVDAFLQTDAPGIYAAGDVAAFPDPLTGERIRIEHWVTAERQGQTAAANMLGARDPFGAVPFFWTEQYGTALRYVGRSTAWDEVRIDGDPGTGDFTARYYEAGKLRASASVGRDRDNLEDERRLEAELAETLAAAGTSSRERHPMPAC